jgi:hypothetical protein
MEAKGHFRVDRLENLEHLGDILTFGFRGPPPSIHFHLPVFWVNGMEYRPGPEPGAIEKWITVRDIDVNSITHLEIGEKFIDGMPRKHIFITTYKDGYRRSYPPGITSFKIAGFSKVKEFYSPKYQVVETNKSDDNRSTLYWNPNVQTDRNGRARLSFYNSDKESAYTISAEGISNSGNVGATIQAMKFDR